MFIIMTADQMFFKVLLSLRVYAFLLDFLDDFLRSEFRKKRMVLLLQKRVLENLQDCVLHKRTIIL